MAVTVCSTTDYTIIIDGAGSGTATDALRVKWGSSAEQVFAWSHKNKLTLSGDISTAGPFMLESRVGLGAAALEFMDSGGSVKSTLYSEYGIWEMGQGAILKVESSCPTDSPPAGETRLLSDTSTPEYAVLVRLSGAWKKITLT